jgi:hypothetical protein
VLVYISGSGDGKSFLTQFNEVITIQEVWDRFDAAGVVGKPRVLVMDLFQIRSTLMDNFMEDIKNVQRNIDDFQRELDVLELQAFSLSLSLSLALSRSFSLSRSLYTHKPETRNPKP